MNQNLFPSQYLHPSISYVNTTFQISNTSYKETHFVTGCLHILAIVTSMINGDVTFRLQSFQIGGKLYQIIFPLTLTHGSGFEKKYILG